MSMVEMNVNEPLMKCRKRLGERKSKKLNNLTTSLEETCLLSKFSPALRWHELHTGLYAELGNQSSDVKGKIQVGMTYKYESTEDGEWDGMLRSSEETSVMEVERREHIFQASDMRKLRQEKEASRVARRYL